jgi:hypothetical protein
MDATVGISLCSYLYVKLAKMLCLSYYLLCFLFNKIGKEEGGIEARNGMEIRVQVGQTMYTHLSKCKNEKNK